MPSLKLTCSLLKITGWKMNFPYFQKLFLLVSGRVWILGITSDLLLHPGPPNVWYISIPTCTLYFAAFHVGKYTSPILSGPGSLSQIFLLFIDLQTFKPTKTLPSSRSASACLKIDIRMRQFVLRSKGMLYKNQDPHVRSLVLKEIYGYYLSTCWK